VIKVEFKKPTPPDQFDDWVRRGDAAAKKLKNAKGVKEKLYKEQRKFFLELFNGKCAYCEAKIILDQHGGDVEHYRPKGGVTDENDQAIEIDDGNGTKQPHYGYYWLVYSWQNLLPSCIACNRPGSSGGQRVGKWNRFPVVGKHACSPAEIAKEKPLLLNPLLPDDDPAYHFTFDPRTGRIMGTTDRGRMTERVLNLNREGLPEARREVYDSVLLRVGDITDAQVRGDVQRFHDHVKFLSRHKHGEASYAMAGRLALEHYKRALREQEQLLGDG
jgi:uncharacterized protein (TIGR02646 family)